MQDSGRKSRKLRKPTKPSKPREMLGRGSLASSGFSWPLGGSYEIMPVPKFSAIVIGFQKTRLLGKFAGSYQVSPSPAKSKFDLFGVDAYFMMLVFNDSQLRQVIFLLG